MVKDKILLAWDTTERINWGARAAHVSLRQILEDKFENIETINGKYQTKEIPVGSKMPSWFSSPMYKRREKFSLAKVYTKVESFFGAKKDFIEEDPEKSANNIIKYKDKKEIKKIFEKVKEAEKVVIDGNGEMVFRNRYSRHIPSILALIELSRKMKKQTYYVNSIFSDHSKTGRNQELAKKCVSYISSCDVISFRDPSSKKLFRKLSNGRRAGVIPDSLFHWYKYLSNSKKYIPSDGSFVLPYRREKSKHFDKINFGEDYICVTGGSRAASTQKKAFRGYCDLVEQLEALDPPVYLVPTCRGDRFLYDVADETQTPIVPAEVPILMGGAILANARLFITGRYHPSIMAATGGTPCVFLRADSHKTLSIQRMLGYEDPHVFSAVPTPDEHDAILARGRELLAGGQQIRTRIQQEAARCAEEAKELATLVNGP